MRDQTELHRARQEAERQRMSVDAIIEQMAEGLLVWDEEVTVVRANQQAQLVFGFTFEEMHGDRDFLLPESRFVDESDQIVAVSELPVQTALRELRVVDSRLWYTRPDGGRLFLWLTASPFFNEQNELAGAVLLVRDITERRRKGEREQQADKLRALGQLASGVAHNFNNALAAVIGYTQLALPKVKEPDVQKYLHVVEQSARDAARMVERIQNFSRGSYRRDDFVQIRLSDIVRDAVDITRPRWRNDAEALGIKYQVKLDWHTDEELIVNGEPSELRVVFVNIILNALDAMVIGGAVTIFASADDSNVSVSFTDTGVGMTQEIKRRIFDPFFTTKGVSGLGMGLSESYRIIERHGGRIDVESRFRRGSTFTIILPRIRPAESAIQPEAISRPLAAARILVIDDEEPARSVLAAILAEQGHQVSAAASAEEALRLLESHDFDVVFTDLAMPKTDGVTAAAKVKSMKPATKVVLMSGYGTEKAHELAGENDCIDAVISKPFKMGEIYETLRVLSHRR
jgi:PAS domain S-box-containing protein